MNIDVFKSVISSKWEILITKKQATVMTWNVAWLYSEFKLLLKAFFVLKLQHAPELNSIDLSRN